MSSTFGIPGGGVSQYIEGTVRKVTTSEQGASFVVLEAGECRAVDLFNSSLVWIEYLRNDEGDAFPIPPGVARLVTGIRNSNQISIRRVDVDNAPLVIPFARML